MDTHVALVTNRTVHAMGSLQLRIGGIPGGQITCNWQCIKLQRAFVMTTFVDIFQSTCSFLRPHSSSKFVTLLAPTESLSDPFINKSKGDEQMVN